MKEHIFQYRAKIKIKKSASSKTIYPSEDKVNWFFLEFNDHKYSFVYNIINKDNSVFDKFFEVEIKFLMYNELKQNLEFNTSYNIFRGDEEIGKLMLLDEINNN